MSDFKDQVFASAREFIDKLERVTEANNKMKSTVPEFMYNDLLSYAEELEVRIELLEDAIRLFMDGEVHKVMSDDKLLPLRFYSVEVDMTDESITVDLVKE